VIRHNIFADNGGGAIFSKSFDTKVHDNVICRTRGRGIELYGTGNFVHDNRIELCGQEGIYLQSGASRSVIHNNRVDQLLTNGDYGAMNYVGIVVNANNCRVHDNVLCQQYPIAAAAITVSGSGNDIHDNDIYGPWALGQPAITINNTDNTAHHNTGCADVTATPVTITDTFSVAGALATTDTGETWTMQNGTTAASDGTVASITNPSTSTLRGATVRARRTDRIRATVTVAAGTGQGCGLLFRYVNPTNWWSLTTDGFLTKMNNGSSSHVASGLAAPANGQTIAVELQGNVIRAYVNGALVSTITDATGQGVPDAGIYAYSGATFRWDNFKIEYF
jgi:hypothetical protein